MKKCIMILTHFREDKCLFQYNWFKQFGVDVKMVWNTSQNKMPNDDFIPVDAPGNVMIFNVKRVLCYFAERLGYDQYILSGSDVFLISRSFVSGIFDDLNSFDVVTSHLVEKPEHYKMYCFNIAKKLYGLSVEDYCHGIGGCDGITLDAVKKYNSMTNHKSYDEIDFPVLTKKYMKVKVIDGIDTRYYNAGELNKDGRLSFPEAKKAKIMHAIKDYSLLEKHGIRIFD